MKVPAEARDLFPDVPRETWDQLAKFVELVRKWQKAVNLVSASSLPQIWERHILDSLQLAFLTSPHARQWIDLGSGGGFPGIVVAAARPETRMHLVESDQRKAAFLREASRELGLDAEVHATRIEHFVASFEGTPDVVSARALASLDKLLNLSCPLLRKGAIGLFPKGQDIERELTDATKSWMIQYELVPSITDPRARIVVIDGIEMLTAPDR